MDPIAKILGDAYATVDRKDNTMNRLLDQMMKKDADLTDEKRNEIKIYIEFDQLDKQLLNESIKKISE
jgi:armadillo repeat-containing protein 4